MKALFVTFSLITFFGARAQNFDTGFENFNTANPYIANGWDTLNRSVPRINSNQQPWIPTYLYNNQPIPSALEGGNYIISDYSALYGSGGTISTWLISPLRTYNNGDKFSFYTRTIGDGTYADKMEIRLSKNGTSTNAGTTATSVGDFTTTLGIINSAFVPYNYPLTWTKFTYTLSGLPASGVGGRIAFRYYIPNGGNNGANGDGVCIDSVSYRMFSPVGLNEKVSELNYKIYPNPAHDVLQLHFPTPSSERKIIIQNAIGDLVIKANVNLLENSINISSLKKDLYFVSIIENNSVVTEKIYIE